MTSGVDFDALAAAISPEQLAKAIGAKRASSGSYHCPGSGHENGDRNPSLSINRPDGSTVAFCHGCGLKGSPVQVAATLWGMTLGDAAERLMSEAGLNLPDVPSTNGRASRLGELVGTYNYTDEASEHLFEVCRYAHPKRFRQRVREGQGWTWKLDGVRRVLYRLPALIEGIALGKTVVIVEGEQDADRLAGLGVVATTAPMGAGNWRDEYTPFLAGATVCVIPDNDKKGEEHAQDVAERLHSTAAEVRIVELPGLPDKGDVSDFLDNGGTVEQLRELAEAAPVWEPNDSDQHDDDHGLDLHQTADEHLTDLGNAQRFHRLYGDRVRYVHPMGRWFVWDRRRWAPNDVGQVSQLAKAAVKAMHEEAPGLTDRTDAKKLSEWAYRSESEAKLNAMISLARTEPGIPATPEQLDADPWAFNVLNGTIDLTNREAAGSRSSRPHHEACPGRI